MDSPQQGVVGGWSFVQTWCGVFLVPQSLLSLVQLVPLQALGLASPSQPAHWLARSEWQLCIQAGESAGLACSCSNSWTPMHSWLRDHALAGSQQQSFGISGRSQVP